MQQSGDKAMGCPGLDHPGQNKKERPKQKDSKKGRKESRRPGLDHPGRNKQQEPPLPGREHAGINGGQTPRTGSSGTDQATGAAVLQTRGSRASGDLTFQTGSSGADQAAGAAAPRIGTSGDKWPADAPDWIIRGRARGSGHNPVGKIDRGNVASRPGQDCPERIKQKESQPPGLERPGESGGRRRRWCRDGGMTGSNAKENAMEMQGYSDEDEAEETHCSNDEDGAVVKRRNRPMDEAAVMRRSSHEGKALEQ